MAEMLLLFPNEWDHPIILNVSTTQITFTSAIKLLHILQTYEFVAH